MRRTLSQWVFALVLFAPGLTHADLAPRQGTFVGYFFVDRWRQPCFDSFHVDPRLIDHLRRNEWRPVRIAATRIDQPGNPGGAMIREVARVEAIDAPLGIRLTLASPRMRYGETTRASVTVTNQSQAPISLARRDLLLRVTVHQRGLLPEGSPRLDSAYDCQKNPYIRELDGVFLLRGTTSDALFTASGDLRMIDGSPQLFLREGGRERRATLYDETPTVIAPGETVTSEYTIGSGWFLNEYELQVAYVRQRPHAFSKPVPFDVVQSVPRENEAEGGRNERGETLCLQSIPAEIDGLSSLDPCSAAPPRREPVSRESVERMTRALDELFAAAEGSTMKRVDFDALYELRNQVLLSLSNLAAAKAEDVHTQVRKYEAIRLLGQWRDPSAYPLLLKEIEFSGPMFINPRTPLGWYPAAEALVKIGPPVAKVIVEERVRAAVNDQQLRLFAWIICLIDGKDLGLARVELAEAKARNLRNASAEANLSRLKQAYQAIDFQDRDQWPRPAASGPAKQGARGK